MNSRRLALCALIAMTACKPPRYEYPDAGTPMPITLESVSPTEALATEEVTLTLLGTGFADDVVVLVGTKALAAVSVLNAAVITATLPAGSEVGVYDVAVVNPSGERAQLNQAFTVKANGTGGMGGGGMGGGSGGGAGRWPAPVVFSVGVTNNAFAPPQSAPRLNLVFESGQAGPFTVVSKKTMAPPTIDGLDNEWSMAPASTVALQPAGTAVGLNATTWATEVMGLGRNWPFDFGVTSAVVKSMFDEQNIYFLVQWSDSTENIDMGTLTYDGDAGIWRRNTLNENRLVFSFSIGNSYPDHNVIGCTAACHVGRHQGNFDAGLLSFRRMMHTLEPGQLVDVWEWDSSTTNPMGAADDYHWDHLSRKGDPASDGGTTTWTSSNVRNLPDGGIEPMFMSSTGIGSSAPAIYVATSGLTPAAVPYSADGGIPNGATVPGMVHRPANPGRDDIRAKGRWANGVWRVELSRARLTAEFTDVQFPNP